MIGYNTVKIKSRPFRGGECYLYKVRKGKVKMGYIRHNAIIVIGDSYQGAQEKFELAYRKAKELFGDLVSDVVKSVIDGYQSGGYQSFFIAPDGSKEHWEESNAFDEKREIFANFIDSLAYSDGSNCLKFLDIGFDEFYEAEIDRKNKKKHNG